MRIALRYPPFAALLAVLHYQSLGVVARVYTSNSGLNAVFVGNREVLLDVHKGTERLIGVCCLQMGRQNY